MQNSVASRKPAFGLMAAAFTPFHADGSLNLGPVEQQAERFTRQGLRGVFVCGSTGEGPALTTAERMAVAKRWCEVGRDSLEIIIHVGHASVEEARLLAADAEKNGAAGIAALPVPAATSRITKVPFWRDRDPSPMPGRKTCT